MRGYVLSKILQCRLAGVGFQVDVRLRKWLGCTPGLTGPAQGGLGRLLLFMGVLPMEAQHSRGLRVAIKPNYIGNVPTLRIKKH